MIDLTQERSIRLVDKPLIPREIIESDLSLQSYLEQNIIENRKDEKIRLRVAKAKQTWTNKRLEAAARKIKIESVQRQKLSKPWNKYNNNEGSGNATAAPPEIKRVDICKQETKEPARGSIVKETRTGIIVDCNHCGHRFTHFSKNLYSQYFCSCSRCHLNIRLKHLKRG